VTALGSSVRSGRGLSRYRVGTPSCDGPTQSPRAGGRRLPAAPPVAGLPGDRGEEVRGGPGRPPGRAAGLLRVLLAVPAAAGGGGRARVRAPGPLRPGPADRRLGGGPVPRHRGRGPAGP